MWTFAKFEENSHAKTQQTQEVNKNRLPLWKLSTSLCSNGSRTRSFLCNFICRIKVDEAGFIARRENAEKAPSMGTLAMQASYQLEPKYDLHLPSRSLLQMSENEW